MYVRGNEKMAKLWEAMEQALTGKVGDPGNVDIVSGGGWKGRWRARARARARPSLPRTPAPRAL